MAKLTSLFKVHTLILAFLAAPMSLAFVGCDMDNDGVNEVGDNDDDVDNALGNGEEGLGNGDEGLGNGEGLGDRDGLDDEGLDDEGLGDEGLGDEDGDGLIE